MPIEESIFKRVSKWIKDHISWTLLIVSMVSALALVSFILYMKQSSPVSQQLQEETIPSTSESTTESTSFLFVDVKGAVVKPGVYQVAPGARTQQVIQLAGGMTKEAEQRAINLAQKVVDQAVIYVPTTGEQTPDTWSNQTSAANSERDSKKVNLNTADEMTLMTLNGIGEKKAQAIVAYRTQHGPFKMVEELKEVDGFGEKTVEKLKDSITIE